VRGLLRVLEEKGHLRHDEQGRQYVYRPSTSTRDAGTSHLTHVVRTFFGGSPAEAMDALLGSRRAPLSAEELDRLARLVERARRGDTDDATEAPDAPDATTRRGRR
jgi:predicted transcriptional regulator